VLKTTSQKDDYRVVNAERGRQWEVIKMASEGGGNGSSRDGAATNDESNGRTTKRQRMDRLIEMSMAFAGVHEATGRRSRHAERIRTPADVNIVAMTAPQRHQTNVITASDLLRLKKIASYGSGRGPPPKTPH
jgi:hypothetical protein